MYVLQTVSGIRLSVCSKLAINQKHDNQVTICWHDVIVNFFWRFYLKFSCWSKFHVNIIIGPGVMTIYKGLTRNPEIRNTPVWVMPNSWRLGRVRDTKFGTDVSYKMLLNATKCHGYSFYRFWVIKEKPGREGGINPSRHPLIHPDYTENIKYAWELRI